MKLVMLVHVPNLVPVLLDLATESMFTAMELVAMESFLLLNNAILAQLAILAV